MESLETETLPLAVPAPAGSAPRHPYLTIKPAKGWVAVDVKEVWQFRDLLFALASRDLKLRYKQTALGVVWVVLQPLITAAIMCFVFGKIAHISTDGIPYFIFFYAGQSMWSLFNSTLTKVGNSLVGNAHLISKVFFPRLILPLSSLPSTLVDFGISIAVLAVLMVINGVVPGWGLVLLPVWILLLLISATGIGLICTSLMVSYRDVAYMLPFVLQILLYATPIVYPLSAVPEKLRIWSGINPLSSVFEAFRWSIFGRGTVDPLQLTYAAVASVAVLLFGVFSFKRMEQKFADVI